MKTFPIHDQTIFLTGPAGKLEVLTSAVDAPRGIAVICHPNPQQGGTMHNKVVTTLHKAFHEANMHTVRFNYRGVGKSEGEFAHTDGEVEDLLAVLAWVEQVCPDLPLYLAGFSFGAHIAYRVAATSKYKNQLKQLITVAPPVQYPQFQGLPTPSCPWLVVQGETDDIVNPQAVYEWLEKLGNPAHLIRFADTGHFFHGKLVELKEKILRNIK